MTSPISNPRGTTDILMDESYQWLFVENKINEICARFGYRKIQLPTFEHTEVFERGVGETTDVVSKEMYTMTDKGGRSITLRPEGTANTARAFLQHGVLGGPLPVRAYYVMSCFRYEKPQSGRQREFYQFGVEVFGSAEPDADCEVIRVAETLMRELGVQKVALEINSIGCPDCRKDYHRALTAYFTSRRESLCATCTDRLARNPLRILDCKNPDCQIISADAPIALGFLCNECATHFSEVRRLLSVYHIPFVVNPRIVRGLDYYSKTVFEFVHQAVGAQGTICGGGRYDGLIELMGGPPTPGIGFGLGIGRLLAAIEDSNAVIPAPSGPALFLCSVGALGRDRVREITGALQNSCISAMYDLNERSLKAQLKYADKIGAICTMVLGDDEIASKKATLRNMRNGTEVVSDIDPVQLAAALNKHIQ